MLTVNYQDCSLPCFEYDSIKT